jgi:DNA-binding protein H-NS
LIQQGNEMASLQEMIAQKEALERQIELTKKQDRDHAIAKVRSLMSEYGLSISDLAATGNSRGKAKTKAGGVKKVAAKYRNKATGDAWSGRGLQPKWLKAALLAGRKIEEFVV